MMFQSHLFAEWASKDLTFLQPFGSPLKNYGGDNPPNNGTMWAQACDKDEVNEKMNMEMEELFAPWMIEKTKELKDTEAIPHPSHAQFGKWVSEAWHANLDGQLCSAMPKATFPNGVKLSQLEDVWFLGAPRSKSKARL